MTRHLTAIVKREGDGHVAICPEVDVASQGKTVVEARDNLAGALALFFETASAGEVNRRLRGELYVTRIEVAVGWTARPVRPRGVPHSRGQRFTEVRRLGSHIAMQKADDESIQVPG